MAVTFTWVVNEMQCIPNQDGNQNVVTNVHWTCSGVDGVYSYSRSGTCGMGFNGGDFIAYDNLTEAQVLDWVWASGSVNKDMIEEMVALTIQDQITPSIVTPPLPWA